MPSLPEIAAAWMAVPLVVTWSRTCWAVAVATGGPSGMSRKGTTCRRALELLNFRETEVLTQIALGYSNAEITKALAMTRVRRRLAEAATRTCAPPSYPVIWAVHPV
jgi:hypothetical protein